MPDSAELPVSKGRLWLGGGIILAGQFGLALIPVVTSSNLPTVWKTALTGLFLIFPELGLLAGVSVLGRPGFDWLKGRLFGLWKGPVGPQRHSLGITLFLLSGLLAWLAPYAAFLFELPLKTLLTCALTADVLFILSLLLLGGEFWDKLRGLLTRSSSPEKKEPGPSEPGGTGEV